MYNVPHLPDEFLLHLVIALFGCFVYVRECLCCVGGFRVGVDFPKREVRLRS